MSTRRGSIRQIVGLLNVRELESAPAFVRASRPRGAKREGLRYEREFASALGPSARHGVWFQGTDTQGAFWAQPDVMLELPDRVLVFECKYTWVPEAAAKLRALYEPLVEVLTGKPAFGIVVCKKLRRDAPAAALCSTLAGAIAFGTAWRGKTSRPVLHWMGTPGSLRLPGQIPGLAAPKRPQMVEMNI